MDTGNAAAGDGQIHQTPGLRNQGERDLSLCVQIGRKVTVFTFLIHVPGLIVKVLFVHDISVFLHNALSFSANVIY